MTIKRHLVVLLLALLSVPALAGVSGTWTASSSRAGRLQMHLRYEDSHVSTSFALDHFEGLTRATIESAESRPVSFRLARDAGTFHLEGAFRTGDGAGHFRFEPSTNFLQDLRSLGVDISEKKRQSDDATLLTLAIFDVTRELVRELQGLGLEGLTIDELTALRIHGASPDVIRELRTLGYTDLSVDDLISLRIHGATPEFIREMASHGVRPPAEQLVAMRIHGVKPAFVRELRNLGYPDLSTDDLVALRIHGVTSDYVRELKSLGYERIDPEELTAMKIHGVSIDFVRALKEAGYENVPVEKLIELKIHGVDSMFVRSLKKKGE
jgi:hypothetical protein